MYGIRQNKTLTFSVWTAMDEHEVNKSVTRQPVIYISIMHIQRESKVFQAA